MDLVGFIVMCVLVGVVKNKRELIIVGYSVNVIFFNNLNIFLIGFCKYDIDFVKVFG